MSTSFRLLRRWAAPKLGASLLPVFAILLLAGLWGTMLYQVDLERQVAHSKAVGQSQAQARALSDYVGNILRQAGHATHVFKLRYEEKGGSYPLAQFSAPGGLLDSVLPVRLAIPMAVYDASGKLADSLNGPMPTSAANTPYFPILARSTSDVDIVTSARVGPHGSAWQIQVARRLSAPDGSFIGVVVMVIEPSLFIDDYDRLDIDERSAVVLISRAAGLSAGRLGESLFTSDTLEFNPVGPVGPRGRRLAEVVPDEALDEVPRIYAASELGRDALVAVVGIPRDVALASFERQRLFYLAFALAGGALIIGVTVMLMQQSARLRASMRAAKEAQAMLRGAVHGSLDAFMLLKEVRGEDGQVADFIIADINEIGAAILKRPRGQLIGQRAFAFMPRLAKTGLFGHYVKVLETGQTHSEEFEVRIEGAAPMWIHHQVVPIEGGVAVTSRDITLRKREEIEIRSSRNFLQSLINNLPLLIFVKSARPENFGQILIWNQAAETVTGYRPDQVIGKRDAEAFPPGFGLTTPAEDLAMLDTPMVVDLPEKPVSRPDGTLRYLHTMSVPLFDAEGELEYILCFAEDVSRRREQDQNLREALAALREGEARLRTIADALPAMIAYIDANEVYRFHNASFMRDFLRGPAVLGSTVRDTIGEQRYQALEPYIRRALAGETVVFEEVDESGGREVAYQITYIPQTGGDGHTIVGFHVMRQDITSHKREKKKLIMLSQIDALTGLTNRAGFFQKLSAAMQNSTSKGALMAVMYMDIDHFKPVNDTYGHNTGDALLKAFSGRLTHTVRASDTVARLGGDEFTIVMENLTRNEDASAIAAKIVAAMQKPFKLGDASVSVSTSIGLAFFQGGLLEPEELLKQADMLLYQAKQEGRNTYRAAI